jgi:GMP synthase (glutamine-hydrolysing)
MINKVLILQIRPEDEAADDEYQAFLRFGGLKEGQVGRVRAEQHDLSALNPRNYSAVIVGGGPYNLSDPDHKKSEVQKRIEDELANIMRIILENDIPYLGACYGIGLLADVLGARVSKERYGEDVGAVGLKLSSEGQKDKLLNNLPENFDAFVGHKEAVQELPEGCTLLASSAMCPIQLIRYKSNVYGTQFHPELDTEGLILRIRTYKHAGYFKPEDADSLIEQAKKENVQYPTQILRTFVETYLK